MGEAVEGQVQQVEGCYQKVAHQRMGSDPSLVVDAALVYLLPLQPSGTPIQPGAPESWRVLINKEYHLSIPTYIKWPKQSSYYKLGYMILDLMCES